MATPKDKAAKAQARAQKAAAKAEKQAAMAKVGKQQSGAPATALTKAWAKAETKAGDLRAVFQSQPPPQPQQQAH